MPAGAKGSYFNPTLLEAQRQGEIGSFYGSTTRRACDPPCLNPLINMPTEPKVYAGIDIGKTSLDVAVGELVFQVPNAPAGYRRMLEQAHSISTTTHFVCEAGEYSRGLLSFLHKNKCPISVIPPMRVRQFARATGTLAKTDRIDAGVLAKFGATLHPAATPRLSKTLRCLREVVRRRGQLVMALRIEKLQRQFLHDKKLRQQSSVAMKRLAKDADALAVRAMKMVEAAPTLRKRSNLLTSVVSVGPWTAAQLIAELPELGTLNRRKIAALAGLAPINHDSGSSVGHRAIFGGRTHARTALFMAAFSAARTNPVLAPFYERLRARGKFQRVAIVAVMRKLLVHLNALVRTNGTSTPPRGRIRRKRPFPLSMKVRAGC